MVKKLDLQLEKDKLEYLYFNLNYDLNKIAGMYGCSRKPIRRLMREYDLNVHSSGIARKIKSNKKLRNIDRPHLYNLYCTKNLTATKMAKILYCSIPTVLNRLRQLDIPIKDMSMSVSNRNFNGKNNPNYIDGRSNFINLLRSSGEYKNWRREVFKRDNYTCKNCGIVSIGNIEAHHKNPIRILIVEFLKLHNSLSLPDDKNILLDLSERYEPFWNLENGETLCKKCHKEESINTWNKIKLAKI